MGEHVIEFGDWTGVCSKCCTNHDGYLPGSLGAEIRCLRSQADAAGATGLVDQVDALARDVAEARNRFLFGAAGDTK